MSKTDLHRELTKLGVSAPEKETQFLNEASLEGVVRWAKDEARRGRPPSSNVIVNKMRGGGLEGYGTLSDGPQAWYRQSGARWDWMQRNVPDADPIYAEAAILQLVCKKREPNPESVKALARQLEVEQAEYEKSCKG
jgi:hypothetical protein